MEFLLGLPFAIFLLLGCVQRGCNKFLLGPFGVCVVEGVGKILAGARLRAEFEKKIKNWIQLSEKKIHCYVFTSYSI